MTVGPNVHTGVCVCARACMHAVTLPAKVVHLDCLSGFLHILCIIIASHRQVKVVYSGSHPFYAKL